MQRIHIVARQLGLARGLARGEEQSLFKWLVASLLFAKPVQQTIAWRAYRLIVEEYEYDAPCKFAGISKAKLVGLLGDAHYVRFDNPTAERLIRLGKKLIREYEGQVRVMASRSNDVDDFAARLKGFLGVGPKAVDIFLHDAAPVLFPTTTPHWRI